MKKLLGSEAIVTLTRLLASLLGFSLLLVGLTLLIMPEVVATALLALSTSGVGINSLRADLGALFLGMSVFTLLGALSNHRWLLLVPIVFLLFIVGGRLIGMSVDGFPTPMADALVGELVFGLVLSLAVASQALSANPQPRPQALKTVLGRRFLISFGTVLVLLSTALALRPQIASRLWNVALVERLAHSQIEELPDGLHIGFAGTGAPMPDARRVGASTFVIAGEHLFIVDSGPGSTVYLELMRVPIERAEAVLLTHLHSDHIAGLGEFLLKAWTRGARTKPMRVLGPRGVESVVEGFNQAFGPDAEYRHAHHGDTVAPREGHGAKAGIIDDFGKDGSKVIFEADGLKVTAFLVDHRPVKPALGYRFDYRSRSVLISGDTLPSESLMRQAKGVDLLVHEAMDPMMLEDLNRAAAAAGQEIAATVAHDILTYHTFPEEAARIARDADAGELVLTHIIPPMPVSVLQSAFLGDSERIYDGPITVAFEGMLFSLAPNTTKISKVWLLR